MVFKDPFEKERDEPASETSGASAVTEPLDSILASPVDRLAAVVADFLLFSPIVAVAVAPFRRSAIEADLLGNKDALLHSYYAAAFTALLALILFRTVSHAVFGATPGQRFMRLRVVSVWTLAKPRPMEAFIRACLWCIDCALVAPLAALYGNEKRRPLHDRAADTVVISTDSKRRSGGAASLAEMSMAGGFQAAVLTFLSISICTQVLKPVSSVDAQLVSGLEADGKLCKEVGEAHSEWAKGPSRLQVALTLYAAKAIDNSCLGQEADFSLWTDAEKSVGYLAKALTEEPEKKEVYFQKACPEGKSDVCRTIAFLRASETVNEIEDPTNPEQKASKVEAENELAALSAVLDEESPSYLKVWVVNRLMNSNQYADAIALLDQITPQNKLGPYLNRERAKALWQLGETEKSQAVFQASVALLTPTGRVELSRWFCAEETAGGNCETSEKSACATLRTSVNRSPNLMMESGVSAAYVRTELCSNDGKITEDRARQIGEQIPEKSGQTFLLAVAKLGGASHEEALADLEKLASARDNDDPFYLEANLKLADLAVNAKDLEPVLKRWKELTPESDAWRGLGLKITNRFGAFGQWSDALENGMKLLRADFRDRQLEETLVVAAYRSGQSEMAKRFLTQLNSKMERALRIPASAEPASPSEFEKIAEELKESRRGTP